MRASLALLAGGSLTFLVGLALLSIPAALMVAGLASSAAALLLNVPDNSRG